MNTVKRSTILVLLLFNAMTVLMLLVGQRQSLPFLHDDLATTLVAVIFTLPLPMFALRVFQRNIPKHLKLNPKHEAAEGCIGQAMGLVMAILLEEVVNEDDDDDDDQNQDILRRGGDTSILAYRLFKAVLAQSNGTRDQSEEDCRSKSKRVAAVSTLMACKTGDDVKRGVENKLPWEKKKEENKERKSNLSLLKSKSMVWNRSSFTMLSQDFRDLDKRGGSDAKVGQFSPKNEAELDINPVGVLRATNYKDFTVANTMVNKKGGGGWCGGRVRSLEDPLLTNDGYSYYDVFGLLVLFLVILGDFFIICVLSSMPNSTKNWGKLLALMFTQDAGIRVATVIAIEMLFFLPGNPVSWCREAYERHKALREASSYVEKDFHIHSSDGVEISYDLRVAGVSTQSLLVRMGLKVGLKILAVNGVLVDSRKQARELMKGMKDDGCWITTLVRATSTPSSSSSSSSSSRNSKNLVEVTLKRDDNGFLLDEQLRIAKVIEGSEAAEKGIKPSWRLLFVNGEKIDSVQDAAINFHIAPRIGIYYQMVFRTQISAISTKLTREQRRDYLNSSQFFDKKGIGDEDELNAAAGSRIKFSKSSRRRGRMNLLNPGFKSANKKKEKDEAKKTYRSKKKPHLLLATPGQSRPSYGKSLW